MTSQWQTEFSFGEWFFFLKWAFSHVFSLSHILWFIIRHRFEPNYSEFQAVIPIFAILPEGVAVHSSNYYFFLLKLVLLVLEHWFFEFSVDDISLLLIDFALVSFLVFGAPKIIIEILDVFGQFYRGAWEGYSPVTQWRQITLLREFSWYWYYWDTFGTVCSGNTETRWFLLRHLDASQCYQCKWWHKCLSITSTTEGTHYTVLPVSIGSL